MARRAQDRAVIFAVALNCYTCEVIEDGGDDGVSQW